MKDLPLKAIERELLGLLADINLRTTLTRAGHIGELLASARGQCEHGEWSAWLASIGLNRKTASDYILAHRGLASGNVRPVGQIGLRAFLEVLRQGRRAMRTEALGAAPATELVPGILHGDGLEWLRQQRDKSVPHIITDPPFGLGQTFDGWKEPDGPDAYRSWFEPFFVEMRRVLSPGGNLLIFQSYAYLGQLHRWYGPEIDVIPACSVVRSARIWTPIVLWRKPGPTPTPIRGTDWLRGGVWDLGGSHATSSNLTLCRELVVRYSTPGSLVVDVFAGVGTIPLACKMEGRQYIGVEQSQQYCDTARCRLTQEA